MSYSIYVSGKDNLLAILLGLLKKATNRIWIEAFILSKDIILETLREKAKERVDVRVLLDLNRENENVWLNKKKELIKMFNVKVKFGDFNLYPTYHIKMIIVDNKVIIGSCNFSDMGLRRSREIMLVIDEPLRLKEFEQIFLEDWDRGIFEADKIREGLRGKAKASLVSLFSKEDKRELELEK